MLYPKVAGMIAAALAMSVAGCKGSSSSSPNTPPPAGGPVSQAESQYPGFYELTREALPSTSSSTPSSNAQKQQSLIAAAPESGSDYTMQSDEFSQAFSVEHNYIGQVFNDAGPSGPVKSMYVLLAQADSIMTTINVQLVDSAGVPTNCTPITNETAITTPFFSSSVNAAFNEWDDADRYTCYVAEENDVVLFGHHAIDSPPGDCTDPFEYYVMTGSSQDDEPNAEHVDIRGDSKDLAAVKKFFYNGCTGDLRLMFAHSTLYSAGVEFSSRSEIIGNIHEHSFSVRSNFIDADVNYAHHVTITGTGISRQTDANGDPAHFIMAYRTNNCGNSSDNTTCSTGATKKFCVANTGTANDYQMAINTTDCAALESDFLMLTPLSRSDIPAGFFDTSEGAFGL